MHTPHNRPLILTIAAFALALGAALGQAAPPPDPLTDDPDAVVIAFGDTTITKAEFAQAFELAARSTAIGQGLPVDDEVLAEFEPFKAAFLEQYATQRILAAEAHARGLAASEDDVAAVVDELRAEQPDGDAFQAWLDTAGYSDEATLRDALAVNLSVQAIVDDLAADIDVSAADVEAWYENNPEAVTMEDGELVPLEAVEEQIAQLLVQEAVDREVQAITLAAGLELHPQGR
jgi:hypothetical protein